MANERILVVDDEDDLLELVSYNLGNYGYKVDCVTSGEDALEKIRLLSPDLILLDLMLPGMDGLDVCRVVKNDSKTSHIPVIMLTARGEEADIVTGLELGADDYITKPFSPRVLIARIKSVLRRGREIDKATVFTRHDIMLNMATHEVQVKNKTVNLTATEFNILLLLIRRPGWVFTRNQIIDTTKGDDYPVTDRSIDVQIVGLRKKLGSCGKYIETVRSVGYRMKE
ncbi:MAG: response regulator transcription factor [Candidatus Latescibacteria bacterium]|nr:response regulator transcription factor [Candidatus Latescibacterota bacterium]